MAKKIGGGEDRVLKDGDHDYPSDRKAHVEVDTEQFELAPDGGWGWFVLIGCFLAHIIIGGFERSVGVFYLLIKGYFNQTAVVSSMVVTISNTLTILLGPLACVLCNRFSVRTVVALGATLCTLGILLSAFSPGIYFLFFSFGLLLGLGLALAYGPSLIIIGQYFYRRRSLAASLGSSGAPLGSCVLPALVEGLFNYYGFVGTFIFLCAIFSHIFICAALYRSIELNRRFVKTDRKKQLGEESTLILDGGARHTYTPITEEDNPYQTTHPEDKCQPTGTIEHKRKEADVKLLDISLLKNNAFLCLCIQVPFAIMSFITVFTYLLALTSERGIDAISGAYLLLIIGICDALTRVLMSLFLDHERIRQYRLIIYNADIFCLALATAVVPMLSTYLQFSIFSGLYGVFIGLYNSQKSVVCVDMLGLEHLSSSLGLFLTFQGVGSIISPVIGGVLKDHLGTYDITFYVSSVGTFVGGVVMAVGNMLFYRRRDSGYGVLR